MAEETKKAARRTEVNDLPAPEKELSADEQRNVKGGQWLTSPAGSAKQSADPAPEQQGAGGGTAWPAF